VLPLYPQLQASSGKNSAQITQLSTQLAQARKAVKAQQSRATAHQQELTNQLQQAQAQAHKASKAQEAKAASVAAFHKMELAALQASHQQTLSDLVAAHAAELARVQGAHRQALSEAAASHQLEVAGLAGQL
jgi:chromosome segregation ATPase